MGWLEWAVQYYYQPLSYHQEMINPILSSFILSRMGVFSKILDYLDIQFINAITNIQFNDWLQ
jgi:hypothetical protein